MNRLKEMACLLALALLGSMDGSAQRVERLLNSDWEFVRLNDRTAATLEAGQQGMDWTSQFNVAHVEAGDGRNSLALSDSLVQAEAVQLRQLGAWERVSLPHTAKVEPYAIVKPWQGVCYYRRRLPLTEADMRSQLLLEFEGAMQLCDVWINGHHAGQHAGGYDTFLIDGSEWLKAGSNEILVRLDNRDNGLIPPGKPLGDLDFCYHSGLYRDVRLIGKHQVHITHPLLADRVAGGGIFVTYPDVSSHKAVVKIQTEVTNQGLQAAEVQVRQTLYERNARGRRGRKMASITAPLRLDCTATQSLRQYIALENPRLWSPDSPQLYLLSTEIVLGKQVVDSEETCLGIRRFEVTREGCYVNGKRYELDGSNRHQEYPYVGNAISDAAQYRDMWQIKQNGFNTVRLGHYPQDPSVLAACNELGLLVIEPIPGWQYYNADSVFVNGTYRDIRRLIRRDRNHPSILLWETTLNESWPPQAWKDGAVKTAHTEMPEGQCYTSGDSYGYSGFDVCYNDWDQSTFSRPNHSTKPAFIREYYDYEFGGHYSTSRVTRGDGERALLQNLWNAQWSHNSNRTHSRATLGGAVWSMYDYNRGCCDNICYSGVADLYRLPKYSLHYYRSQLQAGTPLPGGPMPYECFIASRWDAQSEDTVVVLGNVDEVEIRVNGTPFARRKADVGPTTAYTLQRTSGNSDRLSSPPFVFTGVPFSPGCLEAVGYAKQGKAVVRTRVYTPSTPAKAEISYFESGRPAEQNDLLIVYVTLTDANGHPCHDGGEEVSLQAKGGTVVSPTRIATEDGVASFLVQTATADALQLIASWKGRDYRHKIKLLKPEAARR